MQTQINIDDWDHLRQFLPDNLDDLAKASGSVRRWRNIKSGEELLRLNLAYVVEDLSLRSTAGWSTQSDLAAMKDTSVLHRLRQSAPFLEQVLTHLLNHRVQAEPAAGLPIRLKDATVITIPSSRGTDWRIHATYDPAAERLVRVEVTDSRGGERLDRDRYEPGEVVIGDRGLAKARGIHAVAAAGAYCLLRMHWQNIRLTDAAGQRLDWAEIGKRAENGDMGTIIYVPLHGKPALPARLIVRPLPPATAEKARRQLRRNAQKKGRTPSPQALLLAGYFWLLTTLPESLADDAVALELYRIRWQIELFFKRGKSLLQLDHLRADDPQLVRAYLLGKLIVVAMVTLLATEGEAFSPWGTPRRRWPAPLDMAARSTAPP
jgi:hypothetical protein